MLSALPIHLANSQEVSERLSEVEPTGHEDMKTTVSSLGSLQMEQLTFSYPNALSPALLDVSFILNRGSKTAIVGPSGSGKSTIIDLVLGIESTQDGRILWNNELVEKLEPSSLWKAFKCSITRKSFLLRDCS